MEAGCAAVQYGADAVYLGLPRFSARAEAENFTPDAFRDFAGWAHAQSPRRRVYVAVNTLVQERERGELLDTLAAASDASADAFIVQDLGVFELIRRHFPAIPVHASTQLAIHNPAGALAAARLGAQRVTLARELCLDEVRAVAALGEIETEVFIHGALCYSYSGLCLFSSLLDGHSANRGRCRYPCRGRFASAGRAGHLFSLKDLALTDRVRALAGAGVRALKIEGRKKNALYVAAVTRLYRGLLDRTLAGAEREAAERDARLVFSRPWTRHFLESGDRGAPVEPDAVGHAGVPVGRVESVEKRGATHAIRFTPSEPIERHDGLQIPVAGESLPFGFAVERLSVRDPAGRFRSAYVVQAGETAEVELPPEHPPVEPGAAVRHASSQRVKNSLPVRLPRPGELAERQPVRVACRLAPDILSVSATVEALPGRALSVESSFPGPWEAARNPAGVEEAFRESFSRLGPTPFRLGELRLENPGALFASASRLNAIRRTVMERLGEAFAAARAEWKRTLVRAEETPLEDLPPAPDRLLWSLKTGCLATLEAFTETDAEDLEEIVLDISLETREGLTAGLADLEKRFGRSRIRLALPALCRAPEREELEERTARLLDAGWQRWEIANSWGWTALGLDPAGGADAISRSGIDLRSDWPLYTMNLSALRALRRGGVSVATLSPEDDGENARRLLSRAGGMLQWIVFQDAPLFIGEACPLAALQGGCAGEGSCGEAAAPLSLADGAGQEYLALRRNCRTVLVRREPLSRARFLNGLCAHGLMRARADFLYRDRSAEETLRLWRLLRRGTDPAPSHPGNFERSLA